MNIYIYIEIGCVPMVKWWDSAVVVVDPLCVCVCVCVRVCVCLFVATGKTGEF